MWRTRGHALVVVVVVVVALAINIAPIKSKAKDVGSASMENPILVTIVDTTEIKAAVVRILVRVKEWSNAATIAPPLAPTALPPATTAPLPALTIFLR